MLSDKLLTAVDAQPPGFLIAPASDFLQAISRRNCNKRALPLGTVTENGGSGHARRFFLDKNVELLY